MLVSVKQGKEPLGSIRGKGVLDKLGAISFSKRALPRYVKCLVVRDSESSI